MMKGKARFTKAQAATIRHLLEEKNLRPGKEWQKPFRDELRSMGFYITDFGATNFASEDFDKLVLSGRVRIVD